MKRFQFSLEHVRDYRDRLLDEEKGKLQRFRAEQDQIIHQIAELKTGFAQISAEMQAAQAEGITALEQRGYSMQLENIRLQLRELEEQLETAKARVDHQTSVVVAANQEVSKLDKLRDHQFEIWKTGVQKAEEQRVEELVSQDYIRKTAG